MSRSPETEHLLAAQGARFDYEPKLRLDRVDADLSERDQYRIAVVDQATVDRYATEMAAGDQFPPIIVRREKDRLTIVSGMHRYHAARRIERPHHDAYIITCPPKVGRLISFEENRKHGLALSPGERAEMAARLVRLDGVTQTAAAHAVGVNEAQVSQALLGAECTDRAAALDPPLAVGHMTLLVRVALTRIEDDHLFSEALRLAMAANYGADQAQQLARQILDAADPVDALDVIAERSTLGAASKSGRGGGRRNERDRIIGACYAVLECGVLDVTEYLETDDQAWVLSTLLVRTAKHLMKVDRQVEVEHGRREKPLRSVAS